jgi:hypothetical protein
VEEHKSCHPVGVHEPSPGPSGAAPRGRLRTDARRALDMDLLGTAEAAIKPSSVAPLLCIEAVTGINNRLSINHVR